MDSHARKADDLVVRSAELADLESIFALECASFDADRLSRRALRRFLQSPMKPVIVARAGSSLAGYVLISTRRGGKSARVYSLAVDPRQGRRGVGRELLHACERYARAHGCERVRLEVRYDNAAAISLYEKLGYRQFGSYDGYYEDGAEALRFEKALIAR